MTEACEPFSGVSRRHLRMPHVERGMAVGLFGGSFNPPHRGHLLVSELALQRLRLDQLWWLVTPGNPLKDARGLAPLPERLAASEQLATDPRIKVTALEAGLGTHYTVDMLSEVIARNPAVDFVWIMGADNLGGFHRWRQWRQIAAMLPVAVIDRPGATLSSLHSVFARTFARARRGERLAPSLARMRAPAWTFIHGPRSPLSSTELRKSGKATSAS